MIKKFYWGTRIIGYLACLAGIFLYLSSRTHPGPSTRDIGLSLVGIGFVAFFASYAIWAWIRFGSGNKTDKE